jgi:hypothetical protein
MRILMINYEFPPLGGGGGVGCNQMSREMAGEHHVDYITSGFKGLPKLEDVGGINVHRVWAPGRKDLSTATLLSMMLFFPSSLLAGTRPVRWLRDMKLSKSGGTDTVSASLNVPAMLHDLAGLGAGQVSAAQLTQVQSAVRVASNRPRSGEASSAASRPRRVFPVGTPSQWFRAFRASSISSVPSNSTISCSRAR